MIKVHTLPDCIQCDLTKRAFERRGLPYEEVQMTPDMVDSFRSQGVRSAPVVVSDDLFWYGLRPDMIQEAWKAHREREVGGTQGH